MYVAVVHSKLDPKCSLFKGGEDYVSISLHLGNKSSTVPCTADVEKRCAVCLFFPSKSGSFTCYYLPEAYCMMIYLQLMVPVDITVWS